MAIFKIGTFGHKTWPQAYVPEVANIHELSFYATGSKLSLFSLYRPQFPRYGPMDEQTNFDFISFADKVKQG